MIVSSTGSDFKPIDAGTYVAICSRIIDQGTQESTFNGEKKLKRKVLIGWEVPEVEIEDAHGDKRPALVMSSYTASLHEKAALRKDLESWRGRKFTAEELTGFDLRNILGQPCMINVVHSEDGQYANVQAVMALPKGMPKPGKPNDPIHFDLNEFDDAVFDKLSDKLRDKIKASPEYKAINGGYTEAPVDHERESFPESLPIDLDDEIPF